ncbi:ABC transporter ATP-binding protein [Streptomyces sp. DSM 44917]|uniref:ABC transporter ATP-binding protein n=1 Tax=Streptomyces boetiae TaxID=3075541 RepID=A0ABU2L6Y6_9ACTN|nr:ABC transporter ATP-binding protein [Streptomyces sp. DSM 44917]MDT0307329.1 ABC transporter ATP-binding protein [Streptomyces sp. DSM 44917]
MTAALELRSVDAWYGPVRALEGVGFTVEEGRIAALLGPNGAGKSTTIKAITSAVRSAGSVTFRGAEIGGLPTHRVARLGIATVSSDRGTIPGLTVEDNLRVGAVAGRGRRVADQRERVLGLFPDLRGMLRRPAHLLSGGQQQMLAIGRALMSRPHLLILDEPSQGLAPVIVRSIFATLKDLTAAGEITVLIAEQNAVASLAIADTAVVLSGGTVRARGPAAEIRASTEIADAYLGGRAATAPPKDAP